MRGRYRRRRGLQRAQITERGLGDLAISAFAGDSGSPQHYSITTPDRSMRFDRGRCRWQGEQGEVFDNARATPRRPLPRRTLTSAPGDEPIRRPAGGGRRTASGQDQSLLGRYQGLHRRCGRRGCRDIPRPATGGFSRGFAQGRKTTRRAPRSRPHSPGPGRSRVAPRVEDSCQEVGI